MKLYWIVIFLVPKNLIVTPLNPRQNAEARWWPTATTEPRRFGGIEMRLRSIQIGVFPHI